MTALLDRIPKVIKTLSGIATALIGCATLAFIFGFFARKAQLEAAGIPFAFVDYWSYVEFGVLSSVDCITILFSETWLVAALAAIAALAFLLFEWSWFKRATRSSFLFVCFTGLVLALVGVTLLQLFEVRRLTHEGNVIHKAQQGVDTVPALSFFEGFVPEPLEPPDPTGEVSWPPDAFAGWQALASVVDQTTGAQRLELRPKPVWAVERGADSTGSAETSLFFLGRWLEEPARLDAQRARSLFAVILGVLIWLIGLLGVCVIWHRELKSVAAGEDESFADRRPLVAALLGLEQRFKQEVWLASRWVLLPVTLVGVATVALLMPMAYGSLASNTLSQEMVEVVLKDGSDKKDEAASTSKALRSSTEIGLLEAFQRRDVASGAETDREAVSEALKLIDGYAEKERDERRQMFAQLRRTVQVIAETADSDAALRRLETLMRVAHMRSLDIAEPIRRAWSRLTSRQRSSRQGFILAYPRSTNDSLKLIEWDPIAREAKWLIFPIPQSWVAEIRVRQNHAARDFRDMLLELQDANFEERWHGLQELEATGEPLALEAQVIALFDPSVHVRGWAITRVGQIAASLPATPVGQRRRRYAFEALSRIAYDSTVRPDHRGAAFTSIMRVAEGNGLVETACPGILATVRAEHGDHPSYVGPAMTAGSQLRCPAIGETILAQLDKPAWAATGDLLESVPTALRHNLDNPKAVDALIAISANHSLDEAVRSSAIGHLTKVGSRGADTERVSDHLEALIRAPADARQGPARASGFSRAVALQSIGLLGDRRKVPFLLEIASSDSEKLTHRKRALAALLQLQVEGFEAEVLALARSEAPVEVRARAVEVLRTGGHSTTLVDGLAKLCPPCDLQLCAMVRATLESMAHGGSGHAHRRLEDMPACHQLLGAAPDGDRPGATPVPAGERAALPEVDDDWIKAWIEKEGKTGRPLLVEIWAKSCGYCVKQRPETTKARAEIEAMGVQMVRFEATPTSRLDILVQGSTPAHILFVPPSGVHKSTGLLKSGRILDFVKTNLPSL